MKSNFPFAKVVCISALFATLAGFSAFGQNSTNEKGLKKEQSKVDAEKEQLKNDKSHQLDKLDFQMKQLDVQMEKFKQEMKNLDFSQSQKEIDAAMKKIDAQKISAQVKESLEKIDWKAIETQIDESVAKLQKVKMTEVKREIEKAKAELATHINDIKFETPKIDRKEIKANTKTALKEARKSIEQAKEEINNMKEFSKALQKDGVIDRAKPSKIEVKDGELFIDGQKQSKEIIEKYNKYYRKDNFNFDTTTGETF